MTLQQRLNSMTVVETEQMAHDYCYDLEQYFITRNTMLQTCTYEPHDVNDFNVHIRAYISLQEQRIERQQ